MLQIVRTYIGHAATGFAIAAALVALLFWLDTGQLKQVVALSGSVWLAAALMWLGVGAVFTWVQFAITKRTGHDDDDTGPRGGGGRRGDPREGDMIPIRAEARARQRR